MQRTILLVEDSKYQFTPLAAELKDKNWNVIAAQNLNDSIYEFQTARASRQKIGIAAVDLGIPPGADNPIEGGVKLISELRRMNEGVSFPILAYTSLTPKEFDYSLVVKKLLALRSSFIYLRPINGNINFADLIELSWMGYVIISPQPADFLQKAIPDRPDPLDDKHWETLDLLHQYQTYSQIAYKTKVTVEAIKARVSRIKEILIDAGELPFDAETEDLIQWYLQKKIRYSRF